MQYLSNKGFNSDALSFESINDIEEYNSREIDIKTHIESDKENFLMYRPTFIPLLYHL